MLLRSERKVDKYRQQYNEIKQPHRETKTHFTASGMSSQHNHPDSFSFKGDAFYQWMKSKVRLEAAKSTMLRINLNVEGCVCVLFIGTQFSNLYTVLS